MSGPGHGPPSIVTGYPRDNTKQVQTCQRVVTLAAARARSLAPLLLPRLLLLCPVVDDAPNDTSCASSALGRFRSATVPRVSAHR